MRLRSKLGRYWGDVVEISQPLLPIGIKTPSSMGQTFRALKNDRRSLPRPLLRRRRKGHANADCREKARSYLGGLPSDPARRSSMRHLPKTASTTPDRQVTKARLMAARGVARFLPEDIPT